MCFCVPHQIFCPFCAVVWFNILSIMRCASALGNTCPPWESFRRVYPFPAPMYFLDFIDGVHSDPPYRDLAFIIRPCEACAQKFVRAVRLVKLENAMRSAADGQY
ncbi:hypothetical protein C8J57DRAFT_1591346 [Mycena rebaudengoi]|nr:hypothetical protein C8J57DRAFT_1591346 [Mycena rebaudengoi]